MWGKLVMGGKSQKGFTLIELIIALAIGMVVIGALVGVVYQLFASSESSSNNMMAIRQVQNVGTWVSKDVQQANKVIVGDKATGELITIIWDEYTYWDTSDTEREPYPWIEVTKHKIVYLFEAGKIFREHYYYDFVVNLEDPNDVFPVTPDKTIFIAEYIDIDNTWFLPIGNNIRLTVTATITGFQPQTATRVYEIESRPDTIYWIQ